MGSVTKENLEVALEFITAVGEISKAQNVPAPNAERALTSALRFLNDGPLPAEVLAQKVIEAYGRHLSEIWGQALATAEQIAPLKLIKHSDRYSDNEKAEAEAFIDELVERNTEALKGLAKL